MNFSRICITILLILPGYYLQAVPLDILSIPDSLIHNANVIIRKDNTSLVIKDIGSASYIVEKTITILNESAESMAHIFVHYDKTEKFQSFKGELFDRFGNTVRQFDKRDAKDVSTASENTTANDSRAKIWDMAKISPPFTIHFTYEVELTSLFNFPLWMPVDKAGVSLEDATFTLINNGLIVNQKSQQLLKTIQSGGQCKWQLSGFKAIKREPYLPSTFKTMPYLALSAEEFDYYGFHGSAKTWNSFGSYIYQLNKGQEDLSDVSIPEIDTIIKSEETPKDKIRSIYRYVQNNFRYVSIQLGIGGLQSQKARYTLQQKFGDCKALVTLMKGLLKKAGIVSYMTLVNTDNDRIESEQDFAFSNFDHVILCIPFPNDTTWLECTSTNDPPNYLGKFTEGRNVVIIHENGGTIVKTPVYNEHVNLFTSSEEIKLNDDNTSLITSSTQLNGELQEGLRNAWISGDKNEIESSVISAMDLADAKINSIDFKQVDSRNPLIRLNLTFTQAGVLKKTPSRLIICPALFEPFRNLPTKSSERTMPFDVPFSFTYYDSVSIEIPENYKPENFQDGDKNEIATDFGFVNTHFKFDKTSRKLIIYRVACLREQSYPASKYKEFTTFVIDASKAYAANIVFKKSE